ncbi:hypothetical protein ACFSTE_13745 [Aquimarina hainanensis]|uniref:Bacteriocin immunity protein n=1 Tax=Aquimarina hainanensis TaxID=1578017 RepID=A0ABW5N8V5_9FLAO|nr:hypothetical protein [Aquimarina sp. TRL1]QKX04052.1 hypothetical protein HN014_03735 [Aquimarina sp. TRL1]
MTVTEAKNLIHHEHESDEGLDVLFRMSADIEEERITIFIQALCCLEEYYADKNTIPKELAYQLFSMNGTLKASMGHWKAERPKGLDHDSCWKILDGIRNVFSS